MKTRKMLTLTLAAASMLALGACGDTRGQRALTGGAAGAGVGALGSSLVGGSPWTGAAIGGAAGAATGALTDRDHFD